jgi:hypothetical protein
MGEGGGEGQEGEGGRGERDSECGSPRPPAFLGEDVVRLDVRVACRLVLPSGEDVIVYKDNKEVVLPPISNRREVDFGPGEARRGGDGESSWHDA